jgi:Fic family protein
MTVAEKLGEINRLKLELDSIHHSQDWDEAFLDSVKVDFTYSSNKIEGSKLTYGQTLQLLRDLVTPRNVAPEDLLSAINHKKVLDLVFTDYHTGQISEDRIKSLHAVLMNDVDQWSDYAQYSPGRYKMFENHTVRESGKIHSYLHPDEVPAAMMELISTTNGDISDARLESIDSHPLTIATNFHIKFLNKIHPFADGNGRIARIFMNLIIIKAGLPPIFIKEVNRTEYMACFENSDSTVMLNFMADRLLESLKMKLDFVNALNY